MTTKVAVVEKCASTINWDSFFNFRYELFALCDTYKKKITKKDITLSEDELKDYDYIITVGAEPTKYVAKINSVTTYQGTLLDGKYLPLINPAMLRIRPEGERDFIKAVDKITKYVNGEAITNEAEVVGIEDTDKAIEYVQYLLDNVDLVALDTETSALYPNDGYVLGISLSHKKEQGVYINSDCIDIELEDLLRTLFIEKTCVFHNAKFDMKFLWKHFNFVFPRFHDTMIMHYLLDENDSHGLKELALKYTKLGDYDSELTDYIAKDCRARKIKKSDYTYDLIPFEILAKYAAYDTAATFELFEIFQPKLESSPKLWNVYNNIGLPAVETLAQIENNGVPFDLDRLSQAKSQIGEYLLEVEKQFYKFKVIKSFEEDNKVKFNPNSVFHLREVLFDRLKLPVLKFSTITEAPSTDKETLEALKEQHELPGLVLEYKRWRKIKSTYIDKIVAGIDSDERLRTNFNQHVTTSGRLSSSGKMNLQQLPRDNPVVKWCIKAKEDSVIVSQDLATAEMYVAAFLSGDKNLSSVFDPKNKADFHSSIAKLVFKLAVEAEAVKEKYPDMRQAAKAVSFGVLYGSGPGKVAETTGLSIDEAREVIKQYFQRFNKLKKWLEKESEYIANNGYTFSYYGRKRRLLNVASESSQIASHDVRSGVNFLVQSVASDINLIATIKMQKEIVKRQSKVRIFALVHDSIVAEVPKDELDWYTKRLKEITQNETGICIPGAPIGVDQEIGEDYAFGKGGESFVLQYSNS